MKKILKGFLMISLVLSFFSCQMFNTKTVDDAESAEKASCILFGGISDPLGGQSGQQHAVKDSYEYQEDGSFTITQDGGGSVVFLFTTKVNADTDHETVAGSIKYDLTYNNFKVNYTNENGVTEEYFLTGVLYLESIFSIEYDFDSGTFTIEITYIVYSNEGIEITGTDINDTVTIDLLYTISVSGTENSSTASGSVEGTINNIEIDLDDWSYTYTE